MKYKNLNIKFIEILTNIINYFSKNKDKKRSKFIIRRGWIIKGFKYVSSISEQKLDKII